MDMGIQSLDARRHTCKQRHLNRHHNNSHPLWPDTGCCRRRFLALLRVNTAAASSCPSADLFENSHARFATRSAPVPDEGVPQVFNAQLRKGD